VQDQIFNEELERRVGGRDFGSGMCAKPDAYGFPDTERPELGSDGFPLACIVGYETKEAELSDYARESMERMGIAKEYFMLRHLPELSTRGSYRALLAPVKGFRHSISEDTVTLEFSLPRGSYATVLLNEFMKKESAAEHAASR
jgi:tRNA(Glu) U13 pseudouridine synthase TruD